MAVYSENLVAHNQLLTLSDREIRHLAQRGERYRQKGAYTQAVAHFNQVIESNPSHAWAFAHRGVAYRQLNDHPKALLDFNQALTLKPNYAWVLIHRAYLYTIRRQYQAALIDFDNAIALDEHIIPYRYGERGLLLSYLERYSEAIDSCLHGLQRDPNDYVSSYTLTVAKACWQEITPAEINQTRSHLQTLLKTTQDQAGILYRLGGLAALENNIETALNYLQQAIALGEEPRELAHHDRAWWRLRSDPRFQSVITLGQLN